MSVLKVNNIQNASGTDAISIGSDGSLSYPNIGRRNLIINGAMQVAQRGAGPVTISDSSNEGYQTVDRWYTNFNSSFSGAIQTSQSSDAPNGFANSLKVACTTTGGPDSASTDNLAIWQAIEAQNLQQLAYGSSSPEQITVSFWLKAVTYSAPISVALYVADSVEYATASVTPTTSWAKYSVTFNGSTTGAIDNDNGLGMRVEFILAGTSDGTYAASSDQLTVSSTRVDYVNDIGNFFSSTSNELYITGVQLEVGSVATPFEHRSYGEELALCQRYYERYDGNVYFFDVNDPAIAQSLHMGFRTTKRAAPTITLGSANNLDVLYARGDHDELQGVCITGSHSSTSQGTISSPAWIADAEL